jgi:hypothetical protein
VEGVAVCGGGKWADIKKLGYPAIAARSAVDLKDKWRNLLRIALLPNPPTPKVRERERERERWTSRTSGATCCASRCCPTRPRPR